MTEPIQAIRGMNDILPSETALWQYIEKIMQKSAARFCYQEIRFPCVEKTALFKRSIGDITDIVSKEMYTFQDRNGDNLSLRPEGTASCVRAVIQHSLAYGQAQRLYYQGPYFRHERPQKGRSRQFHHFGAEIFGISTPDADAELIMFSDFIFRELKLRNHVTLEINSLGSLQDRMQYQEALINYFTQHKNQLDEESVLRLEKNPLRLLDSKNPELQSIIKNAPILLDFLSEDSKNHFDTLCAYLDVLSIPYTINPHLVRGLDYYTHTVFEWTSTALGAQNTVCAGGRYDGLCEQLGGNPTPALGFAMGMERLVLLRETVLASQSIAQPAPHIYFMTQEATDATKAGLKYAMQLREKLPALRLMMHCGGGSFKNQFKKADKSAAQFALVLGREELKNQEITLKPLRHGDEQKTMPFNELVKYLEQEINFDE